MEDLWMDLWRIYETNMKELWMDFMEDLWKDLWRILWMIY